MGQKVNPIGFRVGITEDWKSRWYAPKSAYGDFLVEDFNVRKLIDKKLNRKPPFAGTTVFGLYQSAVRGRVPQSDSVPGLG